MALLDVMKGAFTSGELSPRMAARGDIDRYKNGAILLENFQVLVQGGLTRRPGLRYVATVKYPTRLTLLKAFEPSTTDAYILEVGHQYLRFFKNGLPILSSGSPVEVVTPYQEADLRGLRTAQSNDVMILVHPLYSPRRLSRLSDTSWDFRAVIFDAPPTFEAGVSPSVGLTLSATTGTVTVTAGATVFLAGDAQRQLMSGVGRGILTSITSGTVATMKVLEAFSGTSIASGAWTLRGSPVAEAKPSLRSPVGAQVTVTLRGAQAGMTELVTDGSFAGGLASWTVFASTLVASGTHDGPLNASSLTDSTEDFLVDGVQSGQSVLNTSNGSSGLVAGVTQHTVILGAPGLAGGPENDFDAGDAYEVRGTNAVTASAGYAILNAGSAGPPAAIQQAITTVIGTSYQVSFTVSDAPVSLQVGSASQTANVLAEASYDPGAQTASFTATSTTSYLQFRNNQPAAAKVGSVSVKQNTLAGFRTTENATYLKLNGGLIRVTDITSNTATGEIVTELRTTDAAAAGAWSVESIAWSDALGWPVTVMLYEGRLYFAGSARFPQTVWGSAVNNFFTFFTGTTAGDAVEFTLVDSGGNITLNLIRWLMPAENLLVGTTHGEYRLVGAGDDPLSALSLPRNRIQSTFGSDTVSPLKIGSSILFCQRQGSKLRKMIFDSRQLTTFTAQDITVTSDHLLREHRILEMVYHAEPASLVWAVRSDGQVLGLTYDESEQVEAWWRLVTPGSVESVATIPHPTANAHQTWMAVQRTLNGTGTRCVEVLDPDTRMVLPEPVTMLNELRQEQEMIDGWDGLTLDSAVTYSGPPLDHFIAPHLVGETVTIVGDGAVLPSQGMTDTGITLQHPVSTCWIGLPYTSRGRCMPVDVPLRGTTGQTQRKRWNRLTARVEQTAYLVLNGERIPFRQPQMPQNQGVAPFTGDRSVMPLGWDGFGFVSFEVDQALPCTIIGIVGTLDQAVER